MWIYFIGGAAVLIYILIESRGEGDLTIFLKASRDLADGKNMYLIMYNEWFRYYYDVLFALLLFPLTFLPFYFAKLTWLVLNVFFVFRIWKIISHWLPLNQWSEKTKIIFTLLSFLFVMRFLRDNFHVAQVTIFILYLTLEGLYHIGKNKKIAGSAFLALGITIKILPVVFIPYLFYRKEWKAALYTIAFVAVFLLLPALFIGYHFNNELLTERWNLVNPSSQQHILDTSERSFHSLTTLLATLLVENSGDMHALPLKRNIADVPLEQLGWIINIARGILILLTLYFLRTLPFKNVFSPLQRLYEVSYICLIIPLIFPHQQHYAFFFIFPAAAYLLFYLISMEKKNTLLLIFLALIYLATNGSILLGAFNKYYEHYKILTYGALLMIILLAVCRPLKQSDNR